jgi:predicted RNase H-like HicB family nuclease
MRAPGLCNEDGIGSSDGSIDTYHRWFEWSSEYLVYIGRCPDLITGIHGDDPIEVFKELQQVVQEVVDHFEQNGREFPTPRTRPMMEVS